MSFEMPGSYRSKYNHKVKIVQKCNVYKSLISKELLEDFRTYLIKKKIIRIFRDRKYLLKDLKINLLVQIIIIIGSNI